MRETVTYIKERFPLPLVLLLSLGYSFFIIGISLPRLTFIEALPFLLLVTLSFTGFLLRQRVTDEFKDAEHDTNNYPDRPVQRGLINRNQLIALGAIALVLELVSIYLIGGWVALTWYIPFFLYSVLMAKEFFVSTWINQRFTLYFLFHQCIFIFCIIWSYGLFTTEVTLQSLSSAAAVIVALSSAEIIRKFEIRHNTKGKVVADTYPAVWGKRGSFLVLLSLILATGVLLGFGTQSLVPFIISVVTLLALYAVRKNTDGIRIVGTLHFITQAISVVLL